MCEPFSSNSITWCEVTEREIEIAMLLPGEYVKKDNKYYIRRGALDGYVCPCLYENIPLKTLILDFSVNK